MRRWRQRGSRPGIKGIGSSDSTSRGPEAGHPAGVHAAAFRYARESGLACTCHAGEADGPESVRQAIDICGATRIGHGTRLIGDAALMESVADRGICLEICLTSNVQTGAAVPMPRTRLARTSGLGFRRCSAPTTG